MKICCFGSLNLDHVYRVPNFVRPGETISSIELAEVCGGKGLNQSIAMARAGVMVYHAGNVGTDPAGYELKSTLQEQGVRTDFLREISIPSGHTIIQVNDNGENAIICFAGANNAVDTEQIETVLSEFEEGDLLVLQNEINGLSEIIALAHNRGMRIAFNPSPMDHKVLALPLEHCDVLFVNEIEAAALCGRTDASIDTLAKLFPQTMIVYTQGSRGAIVYSEGKYYEQHAFSVNVVDTTGAGDTFSGYFLAAFCEGKSIEAALELAAKAAAISVSRKGASVSIPRRDEVENWNW